MKGLERIRGKVISFLIVNPGLKLWIREMTFLLTVADQSHLEFFTDELIFDSLVEAELDCWLHLHNVSLSRKWYSNEIETIAIRELKTLTISTDASTYQGGVHIEYGNRPGQIIEMSVAWAPHEANLDIACKEILMVKKVLEILPNVSGKKLTFKVDNTVAVNSFKNDGCRNLTVTRIQKEILELAFRRHCHISLDWISTHLQQADAPSRNILSHIDSRINFSLRFAIKAVFSNGVDLFATYSNRVFHRYYSRYDEFQSTGMFVFDTTFLDDDFLYAYPPSSLSQSCIELLQRHPFNPQAMIIHEFSSNSLIHLMASEHFQYRLLVGNRRNPCCLTTGKRLQSDGDVGDYYRNYGEPLRTWLYFRNVSISQIQIVHSMFRKQKHPFAISCNLKYVRRLFRLWRMVVHRDSCVHHQSQHFPVGQCRFNHRCRKDSSPFCFQLQSLGTSNLTQQF